MDNGNTEIQLLRDPEIDPSDEVLASVLEDRYDVYSAFMRKLSDLSIETQWRYYNDGKSWLGKNIFKKKTVFWLSVWEGFFMITMFFNEKTRHGVLELGISDDIKTRFVNERTTGKLFPLLLKIRSEADLKDLYELISYKKSIK